MLNQRRQYQSKELEQLDEIYLELVNFYNKLGTLLLITDIPEYADDTAADADTSFESGKLYTVTGDRTVYKKP